MNFRSTSRSSVDPIAYATMIASINIWSDKMISQDFSRTIFSEI